MILPVGIRKMSCRWSLGHKTRLTGMAEDRHRRPAIIRSDGRRLTPEFSFFNFHKGDFRGELEEENATVSF